MRAGLEKYKSRVISSFQSILDENIKLLKEKVDEYTPTDTKKLINNNKISNSKVTGDKITASVENNTSYGVYVEYGVGGVRYSYHKGPPRKDSTRFFVGVGARMFTRAFDNMSSIIINNFKKGVGK